MSTRRPHHPGFKASPSWPVTRPTVPTDKVASWLSTGWQQAFRQHRQVKVLILSLLGVGLLALLDTATGPELSFAFFYLLPVSFVLWFTTVTGGVVFSLLCSVVWLLANLAAGDHYQGLFVPTWNTSMRFFFFLLVTLLLANIKGRIAREQATSRLDPLTRLYNRRAFTELAEAENNRAARTHRPLSLAYLDLDNFKAVNDAFGHATGDQLLAKVAATLKQQVRCSDLVARLGGDEFVVLFPDAEPTEVKQLLVRLQRALTAEMQQHGWPVTCSIGAITSPQALPSLDLALRAADQLMYRAKAAGKATVTHALWGDEVAA